MLCFLMFRFCCLSVKTVEVCFSRQLIVGIRLIFVLFGFGFGGWDTIHGLQDLSYLTKDRTLTPSRESVES